MQNIVDVRGDNFLTDIQFNQINNMIDSIVASKRRILPRSLPSEDVKQQLWVFVLEKLQQNKGLADISLLAVLCYRRIIDIARQSYMFNVEIQVSDSNSLCLSDPVSFEPDMVVFDIYEHLLDNTKEKQCYKLFMQQSKICDSEDDVLGPTNKKFGVLDWIARQLGFTNGGSWAYATVRSNLQFLIMAYYEEQDMTLLHKLLGVGFKPDKNYYFIKNVKRFNKHFMLVVEKNDCYQLDLSITRVEDNKRFLIQKNIRYEDITYILDNIEVYCLWFKI